MILTNVETVPGTSIVEHFGLVNGSTFELSTSDGILWLP